MQMPPSQAANDIESPLLSIAVEIVTKIFNLLPSFFDVLALAATCRQLRRIWTTNVTTIYSQVAPRSISCERYARRFLADQGGPAMDYPTLSAIDVLCMLRNSCVTEKAMLQFEKDLVHRVKTTGVSTEVLEKYYGPGARRHPPSLTRTERRRFTRSYYQLWGMMKLDPAKWQSRLESMNLKQLYELHEISKLWQSIGREEVRPPHRFPDAKPGSISSYNTQRSKERVALSERIWQYIEQIFQRFHNREADVVWMPDGLYEGALGFIVMWDHWQPSQKFLLCGRQRIDPSTPRPSFEKQYLWEDSSDEEVQI